MPCISENPSSPGEPEILVDRRNALGRIRLNRPKALNSLTLAMVRGMDTALTQFEEDAGVAAVLVTGEGERGLCAGGDIRAIHDGGRAGTDLPETFWREEYRMNTRIAGYSKPYIVLMDGIVMGGGAGVSVYGSHRIVTERTRFAMPETGIGFFPDIGASWFLTRQPNEFGTYVALTGEALGAADVIALGLADSYVRSDRLGELIEALAGLEAEGTGRQVSSLIQTFAEEPPAATLEPHRAAIDRLFSFDTVEEILNAVQKEGSAFSEKVPDILQAKSPLSLKVTLRLLRLGRAAARLEACLEREFAATAAVLRSHDFYEGVRAAIIDKDRNPQWRPSRLADVTEADVAAYFEPVTRPVWPEPASQ